MECLKWMVLYILFIVLFNTKRSRAIIVDGIAIVSEDEQTRRKNEVFEECVKNMSTPRLNSYEGHCTRNYDGILCWGDTPAGAVVSQPCPDWVSRFNTKGRVTRQCLDNATWFVHPNTSAAWSNYSDCSPTTNVNPVKLPGLIKKHIWVIQIIYTMGYSLSLGSLIIAVFIMVYFKRLHCPRNTVHVNLFISFMFRALATLLKDSLMPGGALEKDLVTGPDNHIYFNELGGSHWECKTLITFFMYVLVCNYMWIFVEGLYLHMLIFVSVFSERSSVKSYICFGWGAPLLSVVPWVIVRITLEDVRCWNTNPTYGYLWIIRGPITVSIIVNFVLFISIVRVLLSKLSASNTAEARRYRYIKLAKSTLVLIPLFGVHWIVFLFVPDDAPEHLRLIQLYFEMIINSTQGFIVALLFCFLNGDVKAEIRKKWERYKLTRTGSEGGSRTRCTIVSTYVSRARNSLYSIHSTADRGESIHLSSNTNTDLKNSSSSCGGPPTYSFTSISPIKEKPPPYNDVCNGDSKPTRFIKKDSDNRGVGQIAKEEEIRPMMTSHEILP